MINAINAYSIVEKKEENIYLMTSTLGDKVNKEILIILRITRILFLGT